MPEEAFKDAAAKNPVVKLVLGLIARSRVLGVLILCAGAFWGGHKYAGEKIRADKAAELAELKIENLQLKAEIGRLQQERAESDILIDHEMLSQNDSLTSADGRCQIFFADVERRGDSGMLYAVLETTVDTTKERHDGLSAGDRIRIDTRDSYYFIDIHKFWIYYKQGRVAITVHRYRKTG